MRDIARHAGVSIPTVSRVLNESARVRPEVVKRVREAASKLGVSVEVPGKKRAIAFLLGNRAITHPFHSYVMLGAEAYCAEHDYHVVFLTLHYPVRGQVYQLPVPRLLNRRGLVDGFIVAGVNSSSLVDLVVDTKLPCAVFGTTLMDQEVPRGCSVVWVDEMAGAAEVTRHLIDLGHSAVSWVGNCGPPWLRRRAEGYRKAMEAAGLEPRVVSVDADDEQQVGYLAAKSILDRAEAVTAIAAGNDRMAHGVYEALRDHNLTVGQQVSVAGFNDTLEAIILHPSLTTIRVFADQVGRRLAECVVSGIENPGSPLQNITLPTRLIRRDSATAYVKRP